jgi:hypothetical protein
MRVVELRNPMRVSLSASRMKSYRNETIANSQRGHTDQMD